MRRVQEGEREGDEEASEKVGKAVEYEMEKRRV